TSATSDLDRHIAAYSTDSPVPSQDVAAPSTDTTAPASTPAQAAAVSQADTVSSSSLVFLQCGAFSAHENAHRLAASLNQEIAHIEPRRAEVTSSTNLHRVHIGPYNSRAQAVNAAIRIESATGRQATYTQRDAS